ncbi:hypothetical protein MAM1_0211c08065 [Mucor ambiguus]|uniref:C2H2-type domain-containing protein n=1 Tax=Mucor ambiguus TaxID=91626 RepID=A0A0C9MD26_9FUNG|nr:hypothetical protein MAM1_0211c08065 [Mucor ambiguus]
MSRLSKFPCRWASCERSFDNPEDLFNHLSDDHVGRKATNNLCLQCQWNNCGTVAAKRDHLASHLRVHLPLKPSLLSNQPGYKPVRRRRKTTTEPSNKINATTNTTTTTTSQQQTAYASPPKDVSEMSSSDVSSSYSPSYYSISSNPNNYLQQQQPQDPLQDFIADVLQNHSLPTYDEDMMNRLNSIAPALQYQQQQDTSWSLPCEPDAIPALQNWLEQLSANIQTDENIYPDITVSSSTQQQQQPSMPPTDLLATGDYDLYPKLSGTGNAWTSPSPNTAAAAMASLSPSLYPQHNSATSESSAVHTPPSSDLRRSSCQQQQTAPKFWSPGYIHSPTFNVNAFSSASATTASSSISSSSPTSYIKPSDAIDFSSPTHNNHSNEPNKVFETSVTEAAALTPVYDKASAVSFDNKKELMHMMNVFSSSKDDQKYKSENASEQEQQDEPEQDQHDSEEKEEEDGESEDEEVEDDDDTGSIPFAHHILDDDDEQKKSPYADLVGLIKDLKVEDEETIRKRHALLLICVTQVNPAVICEIYELSSEYRQTRSDAVKKVIASMTIGKDASGLSPDVLKNMQTEDNELTKLVYLYLMNYAKNTT